MPSPATPDAGQLDATDTGNHEEAVRAVRQLVEDGIDVVTVNGTFGQLLAHRVKAGGFTRIVV